MAKNAENELKRALPTFRSSVSAKVSAVLAADWEEKVETGLLPAARKHGKRVDAAMENAALSETGREEERERANEDGLREVAAVVEAYAGVLDRRRGEAMAARVASVVPRPPTDAGERIAWEMWGREFRDRALAAGATLTERNLAHQSATDPRMIAAGENAPPVVERAAAGGLPVLTPFVDPATIAAARLARARAAASPEQAAELDAFEHLADAYRALAGFVVAAMEDGAPRSRRA